MSNQPIDAASILKSLSDLCLQLDARRCRSPRGPEAPSIEVGNFSDNLTFLEIAALRMKRDNPVDGVAMLIQLTAHVARKGEAKSLRYLLPVIERMTREVTDRIEVARGGNEVRQGHPAGPFVGGRSRRRAVVR